MPGKIEECKVTEVMERLAPPLAGIGLWAPKSEAQNAKIRPVGRAPWAPESWFYLNPDRLLAAHRNRSQPVETVGSLAFDDGVKLARQFFGDRTDSPATNADFIH